MTRTRRAACRSRCSATARSQTPTSPARRSSSSRSPERSRTGIVTAGTKFTLPYSIHVADRIIHDAEPRGTETLSVAQILSHSSNVGAITIAEKLGSARVAEWIDRFGFGKQTGIDFPGESQGHVLPLDQWSGSTIGNVPIGQGIAVTPDADGVRVRGDRKRRRLDAAAPRRQDRRRDRARLQAAPHRLAGRECDPQADADERRRRARRDRQRGRRSPATRWRARQALRRSRARTGTRRASTSRPSSASCR